MNELISLIKTSYIDRIADINEQKRVWLQLAESYTPDISLYINERPSNKIAAETGDLGLALLWIVQSSIIRPIIREIALKSEHDDTLISMLEKISSSSLCALAHSEDSQKPVILAKRECEYSLNGDKKFITAGLNADFILVTCRKKDEEKISHIVIIAASALTEESRPDLKLDIMKSVNHTGLILKNTVVPYEMIPRMSSSSVRRMVKKWGILERALIIESFLSFLLFAENVLNSAGSEISASAEIKALIAEQAKSVKSQINEALNNDKIDTPNVPLQNILPILDSFKKAYTKIGNRLSEEERIKLKDIFIFNSLK